MTGCTWDEALKMVAEVAPPADSQLGAGLFAGPDVTSVAAAVTPPADPFLRLEMLRREIRDGEMAWRQHLLAVAGAEAGRAAQAMLDDRSMQGSPHQKLDATQPSGSHYQPDQLSTAEAARLVSQVLQFVLNRS